MREICSMTWIFQISRIKGLNNTTQKIRIDAAPSLSVLLLPEIIAGYTDRKNKTFHVESINVNDAVFNLKEGKSDLSSPSIMKN